MKPQTTLFQKFLLVLLGLGLGFLVLEGGLRLAGRALARAQERANLASLQIGGTYRILCLGESTTQKQYPRFLEAALNQGGGGRRFSVLDGGASGINTDVILSRLEPYLEEFRPDLVVAMMGINDHGAAHLPAENPAAAGSARFLNSLKTYKLARLLFHFFFRAGRWSAPPPADLAAYAETGLRYTYEGRIKLAERHFQEGLRAHPGDDRLLAGLGWAYLQECRRGEAEAELKKSLLANPDNELAHFALGRLYSELWRPEPAKEHLKKAVRLNPANYRAYVGLGKVCIGGGDLEQAEAYFKKAAAIAPGNDWVHTVLGQLYASQNKTQLAKEQFTKALQASPGNDKAYAGLEFLSPGPLKPEAAPAYPEAASINAAGYKDLTARNYRALKAALDKRKIRLVCVQYPMRGLAPLKNIFSGQADGVVFVDNEKVFGEAVQRDGAAAYFWDMFGGNFGHCTPKGNKLLGENIAGVILREVFGLGGAAVQGAPRAAAL